MLPSFGAMAQDIPRTTIVRYNVRLVATPLLTALLAFAPTAGAHLPGVAHSGQSQPPADSQRIKRPTSKPYTGDLSIFEDPKRDENLQINRVMDLLKIKEGSSIADELEQRARSTRSKSIPISSSISNGALPRRNLLTFTPCSAKRMIHCCRPRALIRCWC